MNYKITIFRRQSIRVATFTLKISEGSTATRGTVTRSTFKSDEERDFLKLHCLTARLVRKRGPLFLAPAQFDAAEWRVIPCDFLEMLSLLPPGWSFESDPSLPDFPKPPLPDAGIYFAKEGLYIPN